MLIHNVKKYFSLFKQLFEQIDNIQKAVDEYLEKNDVKILLNRIDYTGRIAVKVEWYARS